MAIFNDNNGPVAASADVCAIECVAPPTTANAVGSDCQIIEKLAWLIVTDGSAAGTVALKLKDANGLYRIVTTTPFPITLAATTTYVGALDIRCHGARLAVTLSAGTLLYAELIGQSDSNE